MISMLLKLNEQILEKAEKRKAKKQLRIELALDFLNSQPNVGRQNLFACFECDLADFVAKKTNEALFFQLFINPLNIHAVLKFDQLKNGCSACIQGNFIVHI